MQQQLQSDAYVVVTESCYYSNRGISSPVGQRKMQKLGTDCNCLKGTFLRDLKVIYCKTERSQGLILLPCSHSSCNNDINHRLLMPLRNMYT